MVKEKNIFIITIETSNNSSGTDLLGISFFFRIVLTQSTNLKSLSVIKAKIRSIRFMMDNQQSQEFNSEIPKDYNKKQTFQSQVEVLKELLNDVCRQNADKERDLRRKLRDCSEEKKKLAKTYEEEIGATKKELEKEKLLNRCNKNAQDEMGIIAKENKKLKEENEELRCMISDATQDIHELKNQLLTLKNKMLSEKKEADTLLSEYSGQLDAGRRERVDLQHEVAHVRADLEYVSTLISNEDIVVLRKSEYKLLESSQSLKNSRNSYNFNVYET